MKEKIKEKPKKTKSEAITPWAIFIGIMLLFIIAIGFQTQNVNDAKEQVRDFCLENNFDNMTFTSGGDTQYFCVKDNLAIPVVVTDDGVWIIPQIK